MLSKFFEKYGDDFFPTAPKKGKKTANKTTDSKKNQKNTEKLDEKLDIKNIIKKISEIIPTQFKVEKIKPINPKGYSPEGADFYVYLDFMEKITQIMGGYVPYELISGAFFLLDDLNKRAIPELLHKIANVKKIVKFTEADEEEPMIIPSFVIVNKNKLSLLDIKNDITNFYLATSIDYSLEVDIIVILGQGIVIKDWRDKRAFIALETKDDSMIWFFILLNEYLDINRKKEVDFRSYLTKDVVYNQY